MIIGHTRRLNSLSPARSRLRHIAAAISVLCSVAAHAQTQTQIQTQVAVVSLDRVEIKGQAMLRSDSSPASQTSFDALDLREQAISQPEQIFSRVPGMRVMTYGLGGVVNVISLRGFGGGAHGGDLGFVLDGIPLNEAISHSDGYADLNVVIPLELERIDIVKGPSSVLVGNYNRAGSVFLQTRRRGEYQMADFSLGSFGTFDTQLTGGFKVGSGHLNLAAQASTTNDFRPQSGYQRGNLSGRYTLDFARGDIAISGRSHRGKWDSASYLPMAQFSGDDPYGKSPLAQNDGGDKTFDTLRADASYRLTEDIKLLAFAYGTQQTYARFFTRPVSATTWRQREETYQRNVAGAGFSLNGQGKLAGSPLKWLAGLEQYRETTRYDFFDGTLLRARTGTPVGRQDRDYAFNSNSAFAQVEWSPSPYLRPTVGVRSDSYTGSCSVRSTEVVGGGDPPCNVPLKDISHTSPKLGVRSTVAPGVDLRASYNEGFQLANVRGLYSASNNTSATVFKQKEIGATFGPFADVKVDVALYQLDSDNEIREIPAGSGIFVNSGQTERKGVDLSVGWAFRENWEASLAYGQVSATVIANPNAALVGKLLNGVPESTGTLSLTYAPMLGFGGFATVNHVGKYFYDSAALNRVSYPGYTTVDAGVTWRGKVSGNGVKLRVGVNNLGGEVYASNAFQIGGQSLVAPGAPRTVQTNVQIDFK